MKMAHKQDTRFKKILITGVAGFIGSNLAKRLIEEGYDVVGIDNLSYGVKNQVPDEVKFYPMDIRDKEIVSLFGGVDALFHLAAKNCINDCQNDPLETSDINVTGTVNVIESCRKAGVKKVIYAESSALYEGSQLFPTPEDHLVPESFYAQSKLAGRAFVQAYHRFYKTNYTALRYFCVYGPRQDYRRTIPPVMSAFIIKLLKKENPVIYGNGQKRRDFIYVDDINDFHLLCLNDSRTDHQTYNLGSGTNHSIIDIYNLVESFLCTGIRPEFKSELSGEAEYTLADITKAMQLGWRAKTSLEDGVKNSINYILREVIPTFS